MERKDGEVGPGTASFLKADRSMCKWWEAKHRTWCLTAAPPTKAFIRAWFGVLLEQLADPASVLYRLSVAIRQRAPGLGVGAFACVREAAIMFLCEHEPESPLKPYLPVWLGGGGVAPGGGFMEAFVGFVGHHFDRLCDIAVDRHLTYQMNVPRRMLVTAFGVAVGVRGAGWDPAVAVAHVDVGSASGLGTLLFQSRFHYPKRDLTLGGEDALLSYRGVVRGDVPPGLVLPPVAHRVGVDLAPVDLDDADAVAWARACQPMRSRQDFEEALVALRSPPGRDGVTFVAGNAATDMGAVLDSLPPGMPVVVTDTVAVVYLSLEEQEAFRAALADAAACRPLLWVAFDQVTPMGKLGKNLVHGEAPPIPAEDKLSRAYLTVSRWDDAGGRHTQVLGYSDVQGDLALTLL